MLSNAYFLAKFRFDTAENEPAKNLHNFAKKIANFPNFAALDLRGAEVQVRAELELGCLLPADDEAERLLAHHGRRGHLRSESRR